MHASIYRLYRDVVINGIICSSVFPRGLRWRALRATGMQVERSSINGGAFFGTNNIAIGKDTFVNNDAFFDTAARITIGERVSFGPRVTIITGTHRIGGTDRRAADMVAAPVTIGSGSWIGASATILPGVTLAPGTVIAAGAVVTQDCLEPGVYGGVPAKLLRPAVDLEP